jgi:hypothetical protein
MSGKHWVTEPSAYIEPKIGKSGFASIEAKTVVEVFKECVAKHGDRKALFLKRAVNVSRAKFIWEDPSAEFVFMKAIM